MISLLAKLLLSMSVSAGVLSGGGGSTVEVDTIDFLSLQDIVAASRTELVLFLNAHQKMPKEPQSIQSLPEFAKLFPPAPASTILDVIKNTEIFLNPDHYRPCKDTNQNPVDASIYSPKPNSICISRDRVAFKLSKGEARPQILALIAHEYSHLMGLNEEEATNLQKAIYRIDNLDSIDHVSSRLHEVKVALEKLRGAFINNESYIDEPKNWNYYCDLFTKTVDYFDEANSFRKLENFSFGDKKDTSSDRAYNIKNTALYYATCGLSDYKPRRQVYRAQYEKVFGLDKTISAEKWERVLSLIPEVTDSSVQLRKVENLALVETEIADLVPYIEKQLSRMAVLERMKRELITY